MIYKMAAEVLKCFMRDVYDYEIDANYIKRFVDAQSGNLKLALVFVDPFLKASLIFRFMWKSVLGNWPPFQMTQEFLKNNPSTDADGDIDIKKFHEYIIEKVALLKFLGIDGNSLEKKKQALKMELRDVHNVKNMILQKFAYRFCVEESGNTTSLFSLYKTLATNKAALATIASIDKQLAITKGIEPYGFPTDISSVMEYYQHSDKMIEYYNLDRYNIFTRHINTAATPSPQQTIFDAISATCLRDSSFCRFLLGAYSIYWHSGDAISGNKLYNLAKTMDAREGKNIILFKSPDKQAEFKRDFHLMVFDVLHPEILFYAPKIINYFVVVSDTIYPPIKSICAKDDGALYYCMGLGENTEDEHNLAYYDKYISADMALTYQIAPLVNGKHKLQVATIPATATEGSRDIIFNNEFVQHQWNSHFSLRSPYSLYGTDKYHPKHNVLLFDQLLLHYYMEHYDELQEVKATKGARNSVVVADNRENIFTVISAFFTLRNLSNWSLEVVCNEDNRAYYEKYFGDRATYHTDFYFPTKKFDIEVYNNLLKNPDFWERFLGYDRLLFVQDDGMVLRKGLEETGLMEYEYVGAPWEMKWAVQDPNKFIKERVNPEMVGNGGVSLRCPKTMMEICEEYADQAKNLHYDLMQQEPEDVFFSRCCTEKERNLPKYDVAQTFASEQVLNKDCLGFHKVWVYHALPDVAAFFNGFLTKYKI